MYRILRKEKKLGVYNLEYRFNGIRHRKRIKCLPSSVEKVHFDWIKKISEGQAKDITLRKAIEKYFKFSETSKSWDEFVGIKRNLGHLSMIHDKPLNKITNQEIHDCFIKHNYKNPFTYNRRINVVSAFLNWCDIQGYGVSSKLARGLKRPEPESKPVFLTKEQVRLMFSRCKMEHQRTFLLLALFTGMRHGEIVNLKWDNIHFEGSVIVLEGAKTKNKKTRYIPMIPQLKEYLRKLKRECDFVVSYMGKGITTFIKSWKSIGKDICRIHDLRHYFATILVTSGIPIRLAQSALGHSSIKMTEYYSAVGKNHMEDTAKKFSLILGQHMDNDLF